MDYIIKKPTSLAIENTNICNLACPLCENRLMERKKGFMDYEKYTFLIREVKDFIKEVSFSINAEPLLHPRIVDMVKYAHKNGMETRLGSNAILLKKYAKDLVKAGLDYTNLSMDGISKNTYESYRVSLNPHNNNFEDVKAGIKALCDAKKELNSITPHVQISFMVNKKNEHEINDLLKWAKEIGVNTVLLKAMHFYWVQDSPEIKKIREEWEPNNKDFVRVFDYKKLPECDWAEKNSVVLWDGRLGTCCLDILGKSTFDNVFNEGFMNVWNSRKHIETSNKIKTRDLNICYGCSHGVKEGVFIQTNQLPLSVRLIKKAKKLSGFNFDKPEPYPKGEYN